MFSYYGSKSKIIDIYPEPLHDLIIEPFAGSARYALKFFEKDVLLVDKYPVVIGVWRYLQQCSERDILSLPDVKTGDDIRKFNLSQVEYECLRLLLQQGTVGGSKAYEWGVKSYKQNLRRISESLFKIKHWQLKVADYTEIENQRATWFIDPPYKLKGHKYKFGSKGIDYILLAEWCKSRSGQIVVWENAGADWLPFVPIKKMQGINMINTEAIYTNSMKFQQISLLKS